ncbi:hypothetical protein KQ306_08755 [Synechococcus sp. CS-1324]|uniref:hypothetical protein n=1 Tax=Synechococcus sp. CS-1324 TaxID=2847980 RepID=UPI00223B8731|nr:hypothetical protein [Synechococcus sp. CS-1324]MCT0230937.1 hypothetical protein [Synechococcus sp. CS-1324]
MADHESLLKDFTSYDAYASVCRRIGIAPLTWFEFCRAKESRLASAYTSSAGIQFNAAAIERLIPDPLDFESLSPSLRSKFHLAGTHGAYRDEAEAAQVFYQDTPEPIIRSGSEVLLDSFLDGKHYSHILPHSAGGSYDPINMIWTPARENLIQGDTPLAEHQAALYEMRNNQEAIALSRDIDRIDLLADVGTIGSVVAACAVTGSLNAVSQRLAYLYGMGGSQAISALPQMTELIAADVTYAAVNSSIRGASSAGLAVLTGNPVLGAAIGFVVVDGLSLLGKVLNNQVEPTDAGEFAAKALGSGALVATCIALPPVGISLAVLNVLGSFMRGSAAGAGWIQSEARYK